MTIHIFSTFCSCVDLSTNKDLTSIDPLGCGDALLRFHHKLRLIMGRIPGAALCSPAVHNDCPCPPPGPGPHLQGVVGEAGVVAGPGAGLPPPHPVPPALTLSHLHLYTQDNC